MRFLHTVATLAPVLASPIYRHSTCTSEQSLHIRHWNTDTQAVEFLLPLADESLILKLDTPQWEDALPTFWIADQRISNTSTNLDVLDIAGDTHTLDIKLTAASTSRSETEATFDVHIDGEDTSHTIVARWTHQELTSLYQTQDANLKLICPIHLIMDTTEEEQRLANELEELRLLEEKANALQQEIAARRQSTSVRVAALRTQRPLQDLIHECDGVVCAAKQIATRVYDQINLATKQTNTKSADIPPPDYASVSQTTSNNYLIKALTILASIFCLSWLVLYIKKKCMSMRNRVERAADREERRNARAYRRAARRAEMKKRWSTFFSHLTFSKQQPRMTDYDEKRALILQDALLEQDFSQLEKGDIMEAEIRQLRHAQDVVAGIIHTRDKKLQKDPPPSVIPLPGSPARSRASTGTLPSYNSEDLPDYSSIPEPPNENATTDGFAYYRPSNYAHPPASNASNHTRSTPISSIPQLSPRISAETLRTRLSRAGSL